MTSERGCPENQEQEGNCSEQDYALAVRTSSHYSPYENIEHTRASPISFVEDKRDLRMRF